MRTFLSRWSQLQLWIAGGSLLILATSGLVATVRSIPDSYASISETSLPPGDSEAPELLVENEIAKTSRGRYPAARKLLLSCSACGVVESVRPFERSGFVDEQGAVDRRYLATSRGDATDGVSIPHALAETGFAVTVRFRDGTTKVFNEAIRGTWRAGNRLILIDGAVDARD